MFDGFLPFSRASLMMDVVAVAMLLILPVLYWSVYRVRTRRDFAGHRKIQLLLCSLLFVTVAVFEVDVRIYGWRQFAEGSPYYSTLLFPVLYVHLFFSITTTVLWAVAAVNALRKFDAPPVPNEHSAAHKRVGWCGVVFMSCTAVTGWLFYYLAFVA